MIDASATLSWAFEDESLAVPAQQRAFDERLLVPAHWRAEVLNGLLVGERHGRTTPEQIDAFMVLLGKLEIHTDDRGAPTLAEAGLPIAREHRLTLYDALYVELAASCGVPIATFDKRMLKAAAAMGISVIEP